MASEAEKIEMEKLGITEEAEMVYRYAGFKYRSLKDAMSYAELQLQKDKE